MWLRCGLDPTICRGRRPIGRDWERSGHRGRNGQCVKQITAARDRLDQASVGVAKKVAQADAPSGDAIPWLLLRADKTSGTGIFAKVTYVQRVGTKNGKPPAARCDAASAGTEKRSDYGAEYYFYSGGAAP